MKNNLPSTELKDKNLAQEIAKNIVKINNRIISFIMVFTVLLLFLGSLYVFIKALNGNSIKLSSFPVLDQLLSQKSTIHKTFIFKFFRLMFYYILASLFLLLNTRINVIISDYVKDKKVSETLLFLINLLEAMGIFCACRLYLSSNL